MPVTDDPVSGIVSRVVIGKETTAGTAVTPTIRLLCDGEDLKPKPVIYKSRAISGSIIEAAGLMKKAGEICEGSLTFDLLLSQCTAIMGWALGENGSVVPTPAESLPAYTVEITKGAKVYPIAGCHVNKLTLSGRSGEAVRVTLDLIGMSCTPADSGTAIAVPTYTPLLFPGATLTANANACHFDEYGFTIENNLVAKFHNSTAPLEVRRNGRQVITITNVIHWNAYNYDIITHYLANQTIANVAVFPGSAGTSMTITAAQCEVVGDIPGINDITDVPFNLNLNALASTIGGTDAVAVTFDLS